MISATRRKALLVASVVLAVGLMVSIVVLGFGRPRAEAALSGYNGGFLTAAVWGVAQLSFTVIGALVAFRRPENSVGWILWGSGLLGLTSSLANEYALESYQNGDLPLGDVAAWFSATMSFAITTLFALLVLHFPTGSPPTSRWRWVQGLILLSLTFGLVSGALFWSLRGPVLLSPDIDEIPRAGAAVPFAELTFMTATVAMLGGLVGQVFRFRRSTGDERQQLKWFAYAVALSVLIILIGPVAQLIDEAGETLSTAVGALCVAAGTGIAILKYRLYDIDVVVNKTIVFGVLAAFITAVYVAIVVGVGQTLGSSDEPNLALSIAATAVVAIGFQPVRERIQRLANRLVYGQRSTPYEALKALTQRVASSVETERVASHIAQTLADVTGAEVTRVWLALDHRLVPAASYPENGERPEALTLDGTAGLPPIDDADHVVPVHHHGELLGVLTLTKKRGEQVTPADERVARDLASQTGVVLRNTRLTAELQARLDQISAQADEIRTSRQRIVATQDAERRRLERDIHDGAQQHLVALAVKLRLAKTMTERKPDMATAMLDQLEAQMDDALSTLDELARGIYPPLLEQRGIAEALSARRDGAPMEITVEDRTASRFDPAIELATYFCCLEALQNTAKYAGTTSATVTLESDGDTLTFTVADDGAGFDPAVTPRGSGTKGMSDRLATVGGTLEITSTPGAGTTVTGTIPLRTSVSA